MEFLRNQKGTVCTVLQNRYIFSSYNHVPILIRFDKYFTNKSHLTEANEKIEILTNQGEKLCHIINKHNYSNEKIVEEFQPVFVWCDGVPVHFSVVKDGTEVYCDAVYLERRGFQPLIIWQGYKPLSTPLLNDGEFLLSQSCQTNWKLPVLEIMFKEDTSYVIVMLNGKKERVPFSYDKIKVNGYKLSSSKFDNTTLASSSFVSSISKLLSNSTYSETGDEASYFCNSLNDENIRSPDGESLDCEKVYTFKNDDLVGVNPNKQIHFDVKLKVRVLDEVGKVQHLKECINYSDCHFESNGNTYCFKDLCVSSFENANTSYERQMVHILRQGNWCHILIMEDTGLNNQVKREKTKLKSDFESKAEVQDNLTNFTEHISKLDKYDICSALETSKTNKDSILSSISVSCDKLKTKQSEIIEVDTVPNFEDDNNEIQTYKLTIDNQCSKVDINYYGISSASETNFYHHSVDSISEAESNFLTDNGDLATGSTVSIDNIGLPNVSIHSFQDNKSFEKTEEELRSNKLNESQQLKTADQFKGLDASDSIYLMVDRVANLVINFKGQRALSYMCNNGIMQTTVISDINFIYHEHEWVKLCDVTIPCFVRFDALKSPSTNFFCSLLLWSGENKPSFYAIGENVLAWSFESGGIITQTHPNVIINAKVFNQIHSVSLTGDYKDQIFDQSGEPLKQLQVETLLKINMKKNVMTSDWEVVYASVSAYDKELHYELIMHPCSKLSHSKSEKDETLKISRRDVQKIFTPDKHTSDLSLQEQTILKNPLIEYFNCRFVKEGSKCVLLRTKCNNFVLNKENICLQSSALKATKSLLVKNESVSVYAVKLKHPFEMEGGMKITYYVLAAWQGLKSCHLEEIIPTVNKNIIAYSFNAELEMTKIFSLLANEFSIMKYFHNTLKPEKQTTGKDKISTCHIKPDSKDKLPSINDSFVGHKLLKMPKYTYSVQGWISDYQNDEGIFRVSDLNLNNSKVKVLCYFNRKVAYINNKGTAIEDESNFVQTIAEHQKAKVLYVAVIYPCETGVLFDKKYNFCTLVCWRKFMPYIVSLQPLQPPLQPFESATNSRKLPQVQSDEANALNCSINVFYHVQGSICTVKGDEAIFFVSNDFENCASKIQSLIGMFCYLCKEVAYISKKGSVFTDKPSFVNAVKQQAAANVLYSAIIFKIEQEKIYDKNVKYCVALLWIHKTSSNIPSLPFRLVIPPYSVIKNKTVLGNTKNGNCDKKKVSESSDKKVFKSGIHIQETEKVSGPLKLERTIGKQNHSSHLEVEVKKPKQNSHYADSIPEPPTPVTKRFAGDFRPLSCLGFVNEIEDSYGTLKTPSQTTLQFTRNQCFLYGISLHSFSLKDFLKLGSSVEFETDSSGTITEVWIGGGPQSVPMQTYKKVLTWCNFSQVHKDVMLKLLQKCEWIPPSCDPITVVGTSQPIVTLD